MNNDGKIPGTQTPEGLEDMSLPELHTIIEKMREDAMVCEKINTHLIQKMQILNVAIYDMKEAQKTVTHLRQKIEQQNMALNDMRTKLRKVGGTKRIYRRRKTRHRKTRRR